MAAMSERGINTHFGMPKNGSKMVSMIPKKRVETAAPIPSMRKIVFGRVANRLVSVPNEIIWVFRFSK